MCAHEHNRTTRRTSASPDAENVRRVRDDGGGPAASPRSLPAIVLAASALIVVPGGCIEGDLREEGKPPEVIVTPRGSAVDRVAELRAKRAERDRSEAEADRAERAAEAPQPATEPPVGSTATDPRTGDARSRTFHLSSCRLLEAVRGADRITFASKWDALDGGYDPCPQCCGSR